MGKTRGARAVLVFRFFFSSLSFEFVLDFFWRCESLDRRRSTGQRIAVRSRVSRESEEGVVERSSVICVCVCVCEVMREE